MALGDEQAEQLLTVLVDLDAYGAADVAASIAEASAAPTLT